MYQKHLERALTFMKGALNFFWKGLTELAIVTWANKLISSGVIVAIVAAIVVSVYFFGGSPGDGQDDIRREVKLIRIGDIASAEPLSLIGEIRAVREAFVAFDVGGTVRGVYRDLGDFVASGTILAELENSREAAGVSQARAALDKARSGAAVGGLTVGTAESSYEASYASALNQLTSARTTISDAVRRSADQVFSNPEGTQPKFFVSTSNMQLVFTVESERLQMQQVLSHYALASVPDSHDELLSELEELTAETTQTQKFLGDVALALSGAIANNSVSEADIATYRLEVNGALATMNALRSTVTSTINDLKSKRAAVTIANENLSASSGKSADVSAAEANLAAANAQYEKTVIRAPISGTINRMNLEVGSFSSPGAEAVYITSSGALEAVVYVTERDIRDIAIGARARVGGSVDGTVIRVAHALDPVTKKAEIRVSIPQSAPLVSGQSATIEIERVPSGASQLEKPTVPLSSLKIIPDGAVVFTVSDTNALISIPVTLGIIRGSMIEIDSGVTIDSVIVQDARGLKEGQEVIVNSRQ